VARHGDRTAIAAGSGSLPAVGCVRCQGGGGRVRREGQHILPLVVNVVVVVVVLEDINPTVRPSPFHSPPEDTSCVIVFFDFVHEDDDGSVAAVGVGVAAVGVVVRGRGAVVGRADDEGRGGGNDGQGGDAAVAVVVFVGSDGPEDRRGHA
jgi:hypothetical protein